MSAQGGWSDDELRRVCGVDEVQLASRRADGSLRRYVTMWIVGVEGELYVRSAYGPQNPWYRRALASGTGRLRAGGVERDVRFADADPGVHADLDAAYHAKYDRYGPRIVGSVVGPRTRRRPVPVAARTGLVLVPPGPPNRPHLDPPTLVPGQGPPASSTCSPPCAEPCGPNELRQCVRSPRRERKITDALLDTLAFAA